MEVEGGDEDGEGMDVVDADGELVLEHPGPILAHAHQPLLGVLHVVAPHPQVNHEADYHRGQHPDHHLHRPVLRPLRHPVAPCRREPHHPRPSKLRRLQSAPHGEGIRNRALDRICSWLRPPPL